MPINKSFCHWDKYRVAHEKVARLQEREREASAAHWQLCYDRIPIMMTTMMVMLFHFFSRPLDEVTGFKNISKIISYVIVLMLSYIHNHKIIFKDFADTEFWSHYFRSFHLSVVTKVGSTGPKGRTGKRERGGGGKNQNWAKTVLWGKGKGG